MEKNRENFSSDQVQAAMKLAQTDTAQELLSVLQAQSGPALEEAMARAAAGDLSQTRDLLQQMLADPQAMALLRRLQGQ